MKHLIRKALIALLGVGMAGCEWSGGGDSNSWNDTGTLANFNGTYHGNGNYLVSAYSVSSVATGSGPIYSDVNGEGAGSAALGNTTFSGSTANRPIRPGSVTLVLSGDLGSFRDNGSGALSGQYHTRSGDSFLYNATGTVDYNNGQWTLTLQSGAPLGQDATFSISYSYSSGSGSGSGSSIGSAGSSGVTIYSFTVQQAGNKIKIIDNNGSIYQGSMGEMRTTGNLGTGSTGATFVNGDQVIAPFSASGRSAAGMNVNMTGNFQGTVQGVTTVSERSGSTIVRTTSMALSNRRIIGTWIEDGGKTGDISGISDSAVNVSTSSSTSTNASASVL